MTPGVRASVTTRVNPDVAFATFTGEIGRWRRPGPDFSVDPHRAVGWRIEHGVGGRRLEFYFPETWARFGPRYGYTML